MLYAQVMLLNKFRDYASLKIILGIFYLKELIPDFWLELLFLGNIPA